MEIKKLVKKFVPRSLITTLKNLTVSLVGKEKLNQVDILVNMVYDLYPPIIIINRNVRNGILEFQKKYNISNELKTNVSKNDFMFKYQLLYYKGDFKKTFFEYFESGLNAFNVIKKIAKSKFGNLNEATSILDFASGHGRLERFLVLEYPTENIWVSDIKETANQFQKEQFGVNSIMSTFDPRDYNPNLNFDIIFVGSLFSHLPEHLFKEWLIKLYSLITERGILIVSTHDIKLCTIKSKSGFVYLHSSEDTVISEIEESIQDTTKYGTTFVSSNKMNEILKEIGINSNNCTRFEKALWKGQDIYILTKDSFNFGDMLNFKNYP